MTSICLGREEKLGALAGLDAHARRLERTARGPAVGEHITSERALAPALGGRTVFDR